MPFLFLLSLSFAFEVDAEWLKLMHYEKNLIGNYKSRASSEGFFTSHDRSPQAELDQFLIDYDKRPINDEHVVCKFPYRAKYVVKNQLKPQIVNPNCPKLEKFKATLAPVGVSLIFSSYFLDSPASTFGHTFLRLRRNTPKVANEHQIELLDHGIGYAANPTTMNPILYSVMGFVGGFDGVFSLVPYYYKVREYNDAESRDLWSYDLEMSQNEMLDLVDHIWEVGQAKFPYYYLTENCSYYILEILEIVTHRKLLERIPFWVIPVDTLKAVVEEPKFVSEITFRPSLKSQFEARIATLNKIEQKQVQSLTFNDSWSTPQIDAAIEYLELKYAKQLQNEKSDEFKLKDRLLSARAKRLESSKLSVPIPEMPHTIHPSSRAGLSIGYNETQKSYLQVEQRFAYYDVLDFPEAKPKFSEIVFMDLAAKYYEDDKNFDIENLDLVRVKIRNPVSLWSTPFSYSFRLGGTRDTLLCDSCFAFNTHFDLGVSYQIGKNHLLYTGVASDWRAASKMDRGFGIYLGPKLEFISYWAKSFRTVMDLSYHDVVDRDFEAFFAGKFEARWDLIQNQLSLSASYSLVDDINESRLGLYYYY